MGALIYFLSTEGICHAVIIIRVTQYQLYTINCEHNDKNQHIKKVSQLNGPFFTFSEKHTTQADSGRHRLW